ncbi:hypothetical protein CL658_02880 [bacterium]|nr:hypothetical protein [bacterium]
MLTKISVFKKKFYTHFLPPFCSICTKKKGYICLSCYDKLSFSISKTSINKHEHFYLSSYTKPLEKLIHSIKFDYYKKALIPLQKKVSTVLQNSILAKHYDAWIPIPSHPLKDYQRGYNIIEKIFKPYFDLQNIPIKHILKRSKNTKALATLSKEKRIKTLKGSITIHTKTPFQAKNVLLVDDIVTTQTTMKECIKVLNRHTCIKTLDCLSLIKT